MTLVQSDDDIKFEIKKVTDFSQHNLSKQINELMFNPWAHCAITERTITFKDMTYNLNTELNTPFTYPSHYFG